MNRRLIGEDARSAREESDCWHFLVQHFLVNTHPDDWLTYIIWC